MCKMKSALYIVAIFSFALVSCTDSIPEKPAPDVEEGNGAITMVKATVNPLHLKGADEVGTYAWSEETSLGIYGSAGANELYSVVKSTTGSNEAYFYGNVVDGNLTIYMPHSVEGGENALGGRVQVRAKQNYYATALDHLMFNSSFLATTTTNEVVFDYYAGLVKILLTHDMQSVNYVKVSAATIDKTAGYNDYVAGYLPVEGYESGIAQAYGETSITIENFPEGVNASVEAPLTVWVALAPGVYDNFVVEFGNAQGDTAVFPVEGEFAVERCAIAEKECVAKRVDHNNGTDDFEGVEGEFNEGK